MWCSVFSYSFCVISPRSFIHSFPRPFKKSHPRLRLTPPPTSLAPAREIVKEFGFSHPSPEPSMPEDLSQTECHAFSEGGVLHFHGGATGCQTGDKGPLARSVKSRAANKSTGIDVSSSDGGASGRLPWTPVSCTLGELCMAQKFGVV